MTKSARFLILAGMLCSLRGALAADPASKMTTNEKGESVWDLNSYLKGTTAQIRDRINGEVERLTAMCKVTKAQIDETQGKITKESAQALSAVRAGADYKALVAERDAAEADKKDKHGQELLDASSREHHARDAIAKMESDAVDQAVHSDRDSSTKLQIELANHHKALAQANAWRDNLVESLRNTFLLDWPVHAGEKGILGHVTVDRVVDAQGLIVRYDAQEIVGAKNGGEGIQNVQTHRHKTLLSLSNVGVDTSKLSSGDDLLLDRNFEIVESLNDADANAAIFIAHPSASPVDELMKSVMVIRDVPQ
jgi:hypothetical protein